MRRAALVSPHLHLSYDIWAHPQIRSSPTPSLRVLQCQCKSQSAGTEVESRCSHAWLVHNTHLQILCILLARNVLGGRVSTCTGLCTNKGYLCIMMYCMCTCVLPRAGGNLQLYALAFIWRITELHRQSWSTRIGKESVLIDHFRKRKKRKTVKEVPMILNYVMFSLIFCEK